MKKSIDSIVVDSSKEIDINIKEMVGRFSYGYTNTLNIRKYKIEKITEKITRFYQQ